MTGRACIAGTRERPLDAGQCCDARAAVTDAPGAASPAGEMGAKWLVQSTASDARAILD